MDWFYEIASGREGPVSASDLLDLYRIRKIQGNTLVWNDTFLDSWKPLFEAGLDLPLARVPPPLPSSGSLLTPSAAPIITTVQVFNVQDFLSSPVTAELVGKNWGYYQKAWTKLLAKSSNPEQTIKHPSWNWAAFLFNMGWFFYRKMYVFGTVCLVIELVTLLVFSEERIGRATRLPIFIINVACGIAANSLYLKKMTALYQNAKQITVDSERKVFSSRNGGSNLGYGLAGFVTIFVTLFVIGAVSDGLDSSEISCSSTKTISLVKQIITDEMKKAGLAIVIDLSKTTISVDAIRTTESKSKINTCSAEINFALKTSDIMRGGPGAQTDTARVAAAEKQISEGMKQIITYTSEYTDKGDQIYVTIRGLNLNK